MVAVEPLDLRGDHSSGRQVREGINREELNRIRLGAGRGASAHELAHEEQLVDVVHARRVRVAVLVDEARAVKLAALVDKNRHPHPPGVHHIYKLFFVCELVGGSPATSTETDAVEFFPVDALPDLSTGRVIAPQIERLYRHHLDRSLPTDFD